MKEYSSYTTADFLNDDLFLFWYYSGEGDYYRKIIADCPDREPYLKGETGGVKVGKAGFTPKRSG